MLWFELRRDPREIPMPAAPKTLEDLFHETLKDIYYAEKAILKALPKMAKKAESEELRAAFEKHRDETETQVERLEEIFSAGQACPRKDLRRHHRPRR